LIIDSVDVSDTPTSDIVSISVVDGLGSGETDTSPPGHFAAIVVGVVDTSTLEISTNAQKGRI